MANWVLQGSSLVLEGDEDISIAMIEGNFVLFREDVSKIPEDQEMKGQLLMRLADAKFTGEQFAADRREFVKKT